MFKRYLSVCLVCLTVELYAQASGEIRYNPNQGKDTTKTSLPSRAIVLLNPDSITIDYHSPAVRKRIIWGGLVPYGEVWVTGAHNAIRLHMPYPFSVHGIIVPAGNYALFTIPGKKAWTVIINKHWEQHLASEYDSKDDVARMTVNPRKSGHTERLQYFIEARSNGRILISMAWEKLRIEFPLTYHN